MRRLVRFVRALVGGALLVAAARWALLELIETAGRSTRRFTWGEGVGAHGERYRLRIRPLDVDETLEAVARERRAWDEAWSR